MTTIAKSSRALNIALWVAQIALAGMFIMAGLMKSTKSIEELSPMLPWVKDFSITTVRFIGVCEFLGALGLLLPSLLKIKPVLTPMAAIGLVLVMSLAALYHLSKGEFSAVGLNAVFGAIAIFIAWGRFKKAPIVAVI